MPFINEIISPEDKVKYNIEKLTNTSLNRWTINKADNLRFFKRMWGMHKEVLAAFWWKDEPIAVTARLELKKDNNSSLVIPVWSEIKIRIPEKLKSKKQEIVDKLIEAIKVCGYEHDTKNIKDVEIEYDNLMEM